MWVKLFIAEKALSCAASLFVSVSVCSQVSTLLCDVTAIAVIGPKLQVLCLCHVDFCIDWLIYLAGSHSSLIKCVNPLCHFLSALTVECMHFISSFDVKMARRKLVLKL